MSFPSHARNPITQLSKCKKRRTNLASRLSRRGNQALFRFDAFGNFSAINKQTSGYWNKNLGCPFPVSPRRPTYVLKLFQATHFIPKHSRSSVLKSKHKKRFTWLINGKASPSLIVTRQERKVLQTGGRSREFFKCFVELMFSWKSDFKWVQLVSIAEHAAQSCVTTFSAGDES